MRKYRNIVTEIDGHKFDSRKEAKYYLVLRDRLQHGEISNLRMQVPYELAPAIYEDEIKHLKTKDKVVRKCVQRAVQYVADFVYTDNASGEEKVIDTKGFRTKEYIVKKKILRALKGIAIIEI